MLASQSDERVTDERLAMPSSRETTAPLNSVERAAIATVLLVLVLCYITFGITIGNFVTPFYGWSKVVLAIFSTFFFVTSRRSLTMLCSSAFVVFNCVLNYYLVEHVGSVGGSRTNPTKFGLWCTTAFALVVISSVDHKLERILGAARAVSGRSNVLSTVSLFSGGYGFCTVLVGNLPFGWWHLLVLPSIAAIVLVSITDDDLDLISLCRLRKGVIYGLRRLGTNPVLVDFLGESFIPIFYSIVCGFAWQNVTFVDPPSLVLISLGCLKLQQTAFRRFGLNLFIFTLIQTVQFYSQALKTGHGISRFCIETLGGSHKCITKWSYCSGAHLVADTIDGMLCSSDLCFGTDPAVSPRPIVTAFCQNVATPDYEYVHHQVYDLEFDTGPFWMGTVALLLLVRVVLSVNASRKREGVEQRLQEGCDYYPPELADEKLSKMRV